MKDECNYSVQRLTVISVNSSRDETVDPKFTVVRVNRFSALVIFFYLYMGIQGNNQQEFVQSSVRNIPVTEIFVLF